ncbi:hypothetical protein O6H91_12G059000 [Diphasiastrum complanatum]|uniref:Uncharacterized protein n=1 Tax=Diphasiastrum complanatum TaxID=34168 RepID=A0ACC2C3F5_DIPCM|nr:hypothetical protein O6H91_12G059000 [Diphasiastrum complanatum]
MAQESWKLDQEETGCQPPEGPIYCANNCGFFGSKATMNMCSKCYRDVVLAQAKTSSVKAASEKVAVAALLPELLVEKSDQVDRSSQVEPVVNVVTAISKSANEVNDSAQDVSHATPSRPINRCFSCNKRVGLTGFKCRCGDLFCSLHRYSDKHSCTFDYKSAGRDAISKANPVVKADKIEKI